MTRFLADETTLLNPNAFFAAFRSCWSDLSKRFLKYEALQDYAQPDEPSYQAFEEGHFLKAVRLIDEQVRRDTGFYEQASSRNIQVVRIRLVLEPLTQYTKLELLSYLRHYILVRMSESLAQISLIQPTRQTSFCLMTGQFSSTTTTRVAPTEVGCSKAPRKSYGSPTLLKNA